jgi:hypothetical protein
MKLLLKSNDRGLVVHPSLELHHKELSLAGTAIAIRTIRPAKNDSFIASFEAFLFEGNDIIGAVHDTLVHKDSSRILVPAA